METLKDLERLIRTQTINNKIIITECPYCKSRFQTYDKDKVFCNDLCEFRQKQIKKVPIEEKHGCSVDEFIGNSLGICRHCGDKLYSYNMNFCDSVCRSSREKYEKKTNTSRNCRACNLKFIPKPELRFYCSEYCNQKKISEQKQKNAKREKEKRELRPKKIGRKVSYEELNRRAELKRLEQEWKRLT